MLGLGRDDADVVEVWSKLSDRHTAPRKTVHRDSQIRWPALNAALKQADPALRLEAELNAQIVQGPSH